MVAIPAAQSGQLHRYNKQLVAFEHTAPSNYASNLLLWVGGLSDGLHTVSYPAALSQNLPSGWSLAQVMLRSSYNGWGTSSLLRDVKELAQCVDYFRKNKPSGSKIVLMGHSTGCQDLMEYLTGKGCADRPPVDGAILQAPVSDREALAEGMTEEKFNSVVSVAQEWIASGRIDDVLPQKITGEFFGRTPISAYRWLSLLSPNHDGDDDYFSSDLPEERLRETFGSIKKGSPLLILFSGADEHVSSSIDKAALVQRWARIVKEGGGIVDEEQGGIINGAHHNLEKDGEEIVDNLCGRVCGFLQKIKGDDSRFGASL